MDRRRKRTEYRQQKQASQPAAATERISLGVPTGSGVYATDRARVGRTTFVDAEHGIVVVRSGFLAFGHTYYIPMRHIREVGPGRVSLRLTRGEVRRMTSPPVSARSAVTQVDAQQFPE